VIGWELPDVLQVFDEAKGPEPSMISAFYTISLNEKANLRLMLEAWRGRQFTELELQGFDLANLMGVACLLQVVHITNSVGDTRAKIQGVGKLPTVMQVAAQVNPSRLFAFEDSGVEDFDRMPAWIQTKISDGSEYADWMLRRVREESQLADRGQQTDDGRQQQQTLVERDPDGEIPF